MTKAKSKPSSPATAGRKAFHDRLGYRFENQKLLDEALTHSSLANRRPKHRHNERLEFLGDRVVGLVIADYLFGRFTDEQEGQLTARYHDCVKNQTLTKLAREIGIEEALGAQPGAGSRGKVLADALEAVIGAIWRDGGMEAVRPVVLDIWGGILGGAEGAAGGGSKDSKSRLQEYALDRGLGLPVYELVDRTGPDHAPEFTVAVKLGRQSTEASGPSKRRAEQGAAARLLEEIQ